MGSLFKLFVYSLENLNIDMFNKDLLLICEALANEMVSDVQKTKMIYDFFIKIFCDINEYNNPILKKSFIVLSYSLCELIPFVDYLRNNNNNLLKSIHFNENVKNIINDLLSNLKNVFLKYYEGLSTIKIEDYTHLTDNCSIYTLDLLRNFIHTEIKVLRYSLANFNEFITIDKKIINFYWHFINTKYERNHGSHDTKNYEIILFFTYLVKHLDTKNFFKNAPFDENNKIFIMPKYFCNNYICQLFTFKHTIDQLNNDIYSFYESLNRNYFKNVCEMNYSKPFKYITTHVNKIYLKNVELPYIPKNEIFYVTNFNYLMNVYLHVFSKMIKFALN